MRALYLVAFGAAALSSVANGFIAPRAPVTCQQKPGRSLRQPRTKMQTLGNGEQRLTYADRLREARAAKQKAAGGNQNIPPAPAPTREVSAPVAAGQQSNESLDGEPESQFSPAVYEELRTAINLLVARLQREKPMSRSEFERFETSVAIIVEDAIPRQELPVEVQESAPPTAVPPLPPAAASPSRRNTMDELESEGPAWDRTTKSYGLPRGTTNTYDIEGMGAMTPEDYQQALRSRVSARARSARESGSYGNIASNAYLNFLNKNPKSEEDIRDEQGKMKDHEDFRMYE